MCALQYKQRIVPVDTESNPKCSPNAPRMSGCFWGVELAFQRVPGVLETEVGYTDGHKEYPLYQQVCSGTTGHTEALRVKFDPRVGKNKLLMHVVTCLVSG